MLARSHATRIAKGGATLAALNLLLSAPAYGAVGNCLDFQPGINYLSVKVDQTNIPTSFANSVGYALANTFSEQIAINSLRKTDPFFEDFAISSTRDALSTALGVGNDASFLFNPRDGSSDNDDIALTFVPSDQSSILSDKRGVIITQGFVDRIAVNAVDSVFGSVDNYKAHLREVATRDYGGYLGANDIQTSGGESQVPVGYLLFGKGLSGSDPVIAQVATFTKEFLSKLMFATAHEVGHIRLRHNEARYTDCADFGARELAADRYATDFLAEFVFRIEPDEFENQRLLDLEAFFQDYAVYEFSGESSRGDCAYPSARKREKEVRKALYRKTIKLKEQTYSAPDITTPTPSSVVCSNAIGEWRVAIGGGVLSDEEIRRQSAEESRKVKAHE